MDSQDCKWVDVIEVDDRHTSLVFKDVKNERYILITVNQEKLAEHNMTVDMLGLMLSNSVQSVQLEETNG